MVVRPSNFGPNPISPTGSTDSGDIRALASQLRTSISEISFFLRRSLEQPHKFDHPDQLEKFAELIQKTYDLSQEAKRIRN